MLSDPTNEKKETDALECGQSSPSPDHEKGSSDQEFPKQVGSAHEPKTREWARSLWRAHSPQRSFWFDDPQAKEIGASASSKGIVAGWVYVRTKTGHLKKRTSR